MRQEPWLSGLCLNAMRVPSGESDGHSRCVVSDAETAVDANAAADEVTSRHPEPSVA